MRMFIIIITLLRLASGQPRLLCDGVCLDVGCNGL